MGKENQQINEEEKQRPPAMISKTPRVLPEATVLDLVLQKSKRVFSIWKRYGIVTVEFSNWSFTSAQTIRPEDVDSRLHLKLFPKRLCPTLSATQVD